jgi:hypothetical protein
MVRDSSPRLDQIYDLVSRTLTDINHDKKEYWVSSEKLLPLSRTAFCGRRATARMGIGELDYHESG